MGTHIHTWYIHKQVHTYMGTYKHTWVHTYTHGINTYSYIDTWALTNIHI